MLKRTNTVLNLGSQKAMHWKIATVKRFDDLAGKTELSSYTKNKFAGYMIALLQIIQAEVLSLVKVGKNLGV